MRVKETKRLIPDDSYNSKSNNFDAIRLTMAIAVVWSHSFALYLGSERSEPVSILLNGTYNAGNLGVMVFFIISGFLVTGSFFSSKSILKFVERRARRIYPGYFVATSICAFIVIPTFAHVMNITPSESLKTIGANLLFRNYFPSSNVFPSNLVPHVINGSLWSIPYEVWCYIGVGSLGIIGLLNRRWFLVIVTVTILFGRVALDLLGKRPSGGFIGFIIGFPYLWFVILPNFLLGMIVYLFQDVIPRRRGFLVGLLISVLLSTYFSSNAAHIVVPFALAYATFYFAFSKSINLNDAGRWGDFSYGTYLYAFPIQQMLIASFFTSIPFMAFIPLAICLSLSAGILSWYLVERWFVRRHKVISYPDVSSHSIGTLQMRAGKH